MNTIIIDAQISSISKIYLQCNEQVQKLEEGQLFEIQNNIVDYCYHFDVNDIVITGVLQYAEPITETINKQNALKYNNNKTFNITEVSKI